MNKNWEAHVKENFNDLKEYTDEQKKIEFKSMM